MILFVDDCPRRQEAMRKAHGRTQLGFARDLLGALQGMLYYTPGPITTIFLDHDGVDGDLLAEWMARHKPHRTAKIKIHSSNAAGSRKMYETLHAAGYDVEEVVFSEVAGCP